MVAQVCTVEWRRCCRLRPIIPTGGFTREDTLLIREDCSDDPRTVLMPEPERPRTAPGPAALAAHDEAVRAGLPTYVDPETGLCVFTSAALKARGYCCGSGCRHCPYDS